MIARRIEILLISRLFITIFDRFQHRVAALEKDTFIFKRSLITHRSRRIGKRDCILTAGNLVTLFFMLYERERFFQNST